MTDSGRILVAAGTNGAGKSRIVGEYLKRVGVAYYDPDVRTRELVAAGLDVSDANARSWADGYGRLRQAIERRESFAFETTLGGHSITRELHRAVQAGLDVRIWYVGLASPELHIARVRARVARGGHDIPEARIRERYTSSLVNLVGFIGAVSELYVFDNSVEMADGRPSVRRVLQMQGREIIRPGLEELVLNAPDWARPVVTAALRSARSAPPRSGAKGE